MSLYPQLILGSLDLMNAPFMVLWGRDHGAPSNVYETLISSLSSGEEISSTRTSNREFSIPIAIDGVDLTELAELEAMLVLECEKPRNTLTVDPGDGAQSGVFETFRAQLRMIFDDDGEIGLLRRYELTIQALPYARSVALTTSPAVTIAASTVVNDGNSAAGWSAPAGVTLTSVSGSVVATYNGSDTSPDGVTVVLTGAIDTSPDHYIAIDWKTSVPAYHAAGVNAGRDSVAEVRGEPLADGYTRSWYYIPGENITSFHFEVLHTPAAVTASTLSIAQVIKAPALPSVGTGRQLARVVDVGGSVRTRGTIDVQNESSSLGDTIVFSYPAGLGYQPPLSPYLYSPTIASRSPDSATASGGYHSVSTASWWWVPVTAIPEGEYLLVGRFLNQGAAGNVTIQYRSRSVMNGIIVDPEGGVMDASPSFYMAASTWKVLTLGIVDLPNTKVGPSGLIEIYLDAVNPSISIDELWLFNTQGDLTIVSAGTYYKRLRIQSPTTDDPQGSISVAYAADWSDAVSASALCQSRAHHNLSPGPNNVFTVTILATNAAVSATHYNRHHTFPGA